MMTATPLRCISLARVREALEAPPASRLRTATRPGVPPALWLRPCSAGMLLQALISASGGITLAPAAAPPCQVHRSG